MTDVKQTAMQYALRCQNLQVNTPDEASSLSKLVTGKSIYTTRIQSTSIRRASCRTHTQLASP